MFVGAPVAERRGGTSRVAARVDDMEVWFESDDLDLSPSPEALVSAFLIPSMAAGRRLVSDAPLAADFAGHLPAAMALVHGWWKYPVLLPQSPGAAGAASARTSEDVALCFSGGVDSFHALLRRPARPNLLLLAHGFDVRLEDTERIGQMRAMIKAVAGATGARAGTVRTNLRQHPLFKSCHWGRTHGGALGALGHLLPAVSRLVIASSYARSLDRQWGSSWDLDPLWSGAGLTVEHFGEEFLRAEKVAAIAREPLVRTHLRVCWRQPTALPNCSRCRKCVGTRTLLSAAGALDGFDLLEGNGTLAAAIDALSATELVSVQHQYRWALRGQLPPDVAAAVRRLLARSRGPVLLDRLGLLELSVRVLRKARHIAGLVGRGSSVPAEP